jgi:hypothetical protein
MTAGVDSDTNTRMRLACAAAASLIARQAFRDTYGARGSLIAGIRDMVRGAFAAAANTPRDEIYLMYEYFQNTGVAHMLVDRMTDLGETPEAPSYVHVACTGLPWCTVFVHIYNAQGCFVDAPPGYPDAPSAVAQCGTAWRIAGLMYVMLELGLTEGVVDIKEPLCIWMHQGAVKPLFAPISRPPEPPSPPGDAPEPAPQEPWTLDESLDALLLFIPESLRIREAQQVRVPPAPTAEST